MSTPALGWLGIARLGLVQTALGAIVVLTTSTINRVMVVELMLPALLPGLLVAWHYALQVLRPRWGHGSDMGGRRTRWIIFGMATLALGGAGAALATAVFQMSTIAGVAVAAIAFTLIGIGVGAAGTSLLALLATRVAPERRGAAATIVWMMMIFGFIVTTVVAGKFLDPFTVWRLVAVTSTVSLLAFLISVAAVWNMEPERASPEAEREPAGSRSEPAFRQVLAEVWEEPQARRFTIFVFISMLAYSMQDLILEPFSGLVFGLTPGQSTQLAGLQHSGVFAGMLLVAVAGHPRLRVGSLKAWTVGGCIASAGALLGLVAAGLGGPGWPLKPAVFLLGVANGAFAVAAIGTMMGLAGSGQKSREGIRMGLWGAAQAIAFGAGGLTGAVAVDVLRQAVPEAALAYAMVFAAEALLFLFSAVLATRAIVERDGRDAAKRPDPLAGESLAHAAG